jgi:hypothetical protein
MFKRHELGVREDHGWNCQELWLLLLWASPCLFPSCTPHTPHDWPHLLFCVGSKVSDEDWSTGQGYYENEFGDIDTDTADIGVLGMPYQVFPPLPPSNCWWETILMLVRCCTRHFSSVMWFFFCNVSIFESWLFVIFVCVLLCWSYTHTHILIHVHVYIYDRL